MIHRLSLTAAFLVALTSSTPTLVQAGPLKVFILAGQSNMQGHARISTFDYIGDDPETAPMLMEMRGADGQPRVLDRVWISSVGCLGDAYTDVTEKHGPLTAGFGAPEDKIGPEFTFGITMEKLLDEPILIIKTSWGGRSLHTDFRPPSGGPYQLSAWQLENYPKQEGHGIPKDFEKWKAEKIADTGVYYREMIKHVKHVLADPKRVCPAYDAAAGYELATSRTVNTSGKMNAFEFLRIVEVEGSLIYKAQPGGAPPTEFTLTELTPTRAVFDNPRHDYPKRIVYELAPDGILTATIGYMKGGTPRRFEFQREAQ